MRIEKSDPELETIVSRIRDDELDLQPDFQRGEIWDKRRRQRLIDTILREWYVPAIHIVRDDDGNDQVLDGQQRLVAIRDFMNDKLRIDGSTLPHDEQIAGFDGLRYSDLPVQTQRSIRRFVIPVITLTNYKPQEPNELFFRLNQSYNLTPPEKRNALHGPARDAVKILVHELEQAGLLKPERIGFSNGRLAYDDIVARACVAIEINDLRRHINNSVVEEHYRIDPFDPSTLHGVQTAGELLLSQIESAGGRIKFNKGTLQTWLLYLYWTSRFTDSLPEQLLNQFELVRRQVRAGDTADVEAADARMLDIVGVYDDRASYRVTDVLSVQARDLTLHLFSHHYFGTPSIRNADQLLDRLLSEPNSNAQKMMFDYIEHSQWGFPLSSNNQDEP